MKDLGTLEKLLTSISQGIEFEDTSLSYGTKVSTNLINAYKLILQDYKGLEINERELMILSSTILGTKSQDHFRISPVNVTGRNSHPSHPFEIPGMISRILYLISKENSQLDTIEKAAIAQGGIFYIQPFRDGNKRLGRVISDRLLFEGDLKPSVYESREHYIDTLFKVSDSLKEDKNKGRLFENFEAFDPMIQIIKQSQS